MGTTTECGSQGPRIGNEGTPICQLPKYHQGRHIPDESWFSEIRDWSDHAIYGVPNKDVPPSDTTANGRTKTEVLLQAALDNSGLDLANLTGNQVHHLAAILRTLPGLFEHVRNNGGQPLGLLPYHARQFALTVVDDPNADA